MNEKQYQSLCGWAARTPARQKCLTACFRLLPVLFVFCTALARSVRCLPLYKNRSVCGLPPFGQSPLPAFCWSP